MFSCYNRKKWVIGMLLKQLKYFICVVDYNGFTKAADNCYISQSAISQQIKALEKELGIELMIREKRSFILTSAGEYLYRHGKELLADFEKVKEETIRRGEDHTLSLKIGYPKNYGGVELQMAINQFSKIYPEVNISIITGNHEELFHLLVEGLIDMKISEQRRAYHDDYVNYELKYSDCFIEISENQELSQKDVLSSDDLKGLTCILVASKESEQSERDFYEHTLRISKKFIFAQTLEQARLLVLGNRGFLPIDAIGDLKEPLEGIKRIPLYHHKHRVQRNYFACWSKDKESYYIEEFADLLRKLLNE